MAIDGGTYQRMVRKLIYLLHTRPTLCTQCCESIDTLSITIPRRHCIQNTYLKASPGKGGKVVKYHNTCNLQLEATKMWIG